ncbi:DUF1835 domain-containing protein [Emticicia sp. SJ17W-69]|uniref:DUF1835 domain-containing protein n=1 Tax=Emticicia sp. SJ17W-69 TaxID=3421657 RepID=UPI003EB86FB3
MATFHLLNGDCLAEQLRATKINQDFIVCREALIDGEVLANNLADFWAIRAKFIADSYGASIEQYFEITVKELEKLTTLPDGSEVCLWFENDLFCQINLWFVLTLLKKNTNLKLHRVFPIIEDQADIWKGFGKASTEKLEEAYASKVPFTANDIELGTKLWNAFLNSDFEKLKDLSKEKSGCFEYLEEVCQAHIDRFPLDNSLGRPQKILKKIIENVPNDFNSIFTKFSEQEGIYGFGDLQIKQLLNV